MLIVTSLHPTHTFKENQHKAIESWKEHGKCHSLNHPKEIPLLEYNINIVPTDKTADMIVGKPLININSMMDFAIEQDDDLLIINSDIIITKMPEFKKDGITIIKRWDYDHQHEESELFHAGFDVFHIPKAFLPLFPPSVFCMGGAWWDYWIPKCAIKLKIPLYYIPDRIAFHKKHSTQYSYEEWVRIGEWFRLYFNISRELTIPQIASQTLNEINSKLIWQHIQ